MFGRFVVPAAIAVLHFSVPASAQAVDAEARAQWAAQCEDWDEWDKPAPPFAIYGNAFYVGTCGIGAILIAGNGQHVLIDSGTEVGAQVVLQNIAALGFDPRDIDLILASHEHHDHVGGMAVIAGAVGRGVTVNANVAQVFSTGLPDPRDPQFAIAETMASVAIEMEILPDTMIGVGDNLWLYALPTPGHTPGALSWQWQSCEGETCLTIVYADSLSAVSSDEYRFSDNPEYVAEFRAGIARLAALDCDILLTPHPSASGMRQKLLDGDLTSGMDCAAYAADRLARLEERLAREVAQ